MPQKNKRNNSAKTTKNHKKYKYPKPENKNKNKSYPKNRHKRNNISLLKKKSKNNIQIINKENTKNNSLIIEDHQILFDIIEDINLLKENEYKNTLYALIENPTNEIKEIKDESYEDEIKTKKEENRAGQYQKKKALLNDLIFSQQEKKFSNENLEEKIKPLFVEKLDEIINFGSKIFKKYNKLNKQKKTKLFINVLTIVKMKILEYKII